MSFRFCLDRDDDGRIDQTKGKKEKENKMTKMRKNHKDLCGKTKVFKISVT